MMKPAAILWDYDGTLVDSVVKNRAVTVQLIRDYFDPEIEKHLPPVLQSVRAYREAVRRSPNWCEMYARELGLNEQQIQRAGQLWSAYQRRDPLQPPLFMGLRDVLPVLSGVAPMAICSQNSSQHIRETLYRYGLQQYFGAVIGVDEVPLARQKPDPAGYLIALQQLGVRGDEGELVYIGDHAADAVFARAALNNLDARGVKTKMVCIGVRFGEEDVPDPEGMDFTVHTPEQLQNILL